MLVRIAGYLAIVSSLGGCTDYLDRRDSLGSSAGDAVHSNTVMHMVDPWPAHARRRSIAFNGERMSRAVDIYRAGPRPAADGSGGGSADGSEGGAAPAR